MMTAPTGAIATMRRPLRLGHVLVTLEDLLIVTWHVPESSLRHVLPPTIHPRLHDGVALLSAVLFRNRALRPAILSVPRLQSCQMNIRSYVTYGHTGEPGA